MRVEIWWDIQLLAKAFNINLRTPLRRGEARPPVDVSPRDDLFDQLDLRWFHQ